MDHVQQIKLVYLAILFGTELVGRRASSSIVLCYVLDYNKNE